MRIANRKELINLFALTVAIGISPQFAWGDDALTVRNKTIVRNFYTTVLIGRNVDAAPVFCARITLKAISEIKFPPA
jgi:hypothetical protein